MYCTLIFFFFFSLKPASIFLIYKALNAKDNKQLFIHVRIRVTLDVACLEVLSHKSDPNDKHYAGRSRMTIHTDKTSCQWVLTSNIRLLNCYVYCMLLMKSTSASKPVSGHGRYLLGAVFSVQVGSRMSLH